jgi:serine/threonine-protein kinase HipA
MSDDAVLVFVDETAAGPVLVGELRPSFQGGRTLASSSFQYDSGYLGRADRYPLSPDLPLTSTRLFTPESQQLFGAFADAAPDEWGRKLIEANHARRLRADAGLPPRIGDFDFLLGVADHSRMGAIRLMSDGAWLSSDDGVADVHDIDRIVAATERYEANEATEADVEYLNSVATSPGGARPKANVVLDDGTLALAKLPHSKDGEIDVERWEAVALTIARSCGIQVPAWTVETGRSGKSVLIVHRFDRDGELRRGYLSAARAMELGTFDDRRLTYQDFAETLAETSARPRADLEELYKRVALTVLINNVDDHWRNHGFIHTGDGWRLSPVFDLNPSARRNLIDSRPISNRDDPRERDLQNLIDISSTFQLDHVRGAEIVRLVAAEVETWPDVADSLDIDGAQQAAMSRAFDVHEIQRAKGARA